MRELLGTMSLWNLQIALMNRYEIGFAVAIFDSDHFKHINDEQGHLQGDRMLQQAASLLDDTARETDIVARYGGEEFVAVMSRADAAMYRAKAAGRDCTFRHDGERVESILDDALVSAVAP